MSSEEFIEKFEKMMSEMREEIKELRAENRKMSEELNQLKAVGCGPTPKIIENPAHLSVLSMKSIIEYFTTNRRLKVSMCAPKFRAIEKLVPLEIEYLELTSSAIRINRMEYEFVREERKKLHCIEALQHYPVTILEECILSNLIQDSVSRVFLDLFRGRPNLRVKEFSFRVKLPYTLNLRVGLIMISRSYNLAQDYSKFLESVDHLIFLELCEPAELTQPWVRNVKRFEKINGDGASLPQELPNLLADKIYIKCDNIENCLNLIRSWSQNTDNRKVGSQLFLTMISATRAQELVTITEIIRSERLPEMGFVRVSSEKFRLPMTNGLEVSLSVDVERDHFNYNYKVFAKFYRYFRVEIVQS